MRIAVIGAGGIGGIYGAALAKASAELPSWRAARISLLCARTV